VTEGKLLFSRDERLRKELVNAIVREYLGFQRVFYPFIACKRWN